MTRNGALAQIKHTDYRLHNSKHPRLRSGFYIAFLCNMWYTVSHHGGVIVATCILSGLEIPEGKETKEHLVPKSRMLSLADTPGNIFPAHKILNCMKGDLLPCEFENLKYQLAAKALYKWHIKESDRRFMCDAVINWNEGYSPNWCDVCILKCKGRQR